MSSKMTSKEILLAYINTLPEQECANLYFILKGIKKDTNYVYFNSEGEVIDVDDTTDVSTYIKVTKNQYGMLMYKFGKEKLKACIKILFIKNYKKDTLGQYNQYRFLIGWVEAEYNRLHRYGELEDGGYSEDTVPFSQIDTQEQAIKWINSLPNVNKNDDAYVFYLRNKFNIAKELLK